MVINVTKTKFMVTNGNEDDRQSITYIDNGTVLSIDHCDEYNYHDCWFTSDRRISSAVRKHACDKQKHFTKFVLF